MKRIKLVVAYDGTNYHGWQVQPREITIEGVLNEALTALTGEEIQVIGASRTDAGVHARGNVAVFDTESRIPGEKFSYALNQRLPEDVIIQDSCEVTADFHPRHCECRKTYEYTILNRTFPLPEYRNTAFFCYGDLDVERMDQAAKQFCCFLFCRSASAVNRPDYLQCDRGAGTAGSDPHTDSWKWISV